MSIQAESLAQANEQMARLAGNDQEGKDDDMDLDEPNLAVAPYGTQAEDQESTDQRVTLLEDTAEVAIIGAASLVELIAAAKLCSDSGDCSNQNGFAVAVGVISTVLCAAAFTLSVLVPDHPSLQDSRPIASAVLLTWWTVAVIVLTFDKPFTHTGNGYFSCWIAFAGSCALAFLSNRQFSMIQAVEHYVGSSAPRERQVGVLLLMTSFIELAEATIQCISRGSWDGLDGFAVAAGFVSVPLTGIVLYLLHPSMDGLSTNKQHAVRSLVVFLGMWWLVSAGILTYNNPFVEGGNGFFGCWGSFILSFRLSYEVNKNLPPLLDSFQESEGGQHAPSNDGLQPKCRAVPVESTTSPIGNHDYDDV